MKKHEHYILTKNAIHDLVEQERYFLKTGRWHCDCGCEECSNLMNFAELSFFEKLTSFYTLWKRMNEIKKAEDYG
jgi:hypothetical protein